ncbi:MAG: HTTM domain-containing protein [Deltaproteobacteria bacterium]|nr:HTTM domain-containing protein [Deltaproteobacteria bacterium]
MIERSLAQRLRARLDAPTDVAALVAFRVLFGLVVAAGALRFVLEGWVARCYLEPTFFFKYWGFSWVRAWPAWGMYLHVALVGVLGLAVAAGFFYRASAALLFLAFTYLELIDVTVYLNHYYLVSLLSLLLACMPLGQAYSLDVLRRPDHRLDAFPAWCTYLLRFQLGAVYIFAALTKMGTDWLLHAQPMQLWLSARSDLPIVGPYLGRFEVALAMSWAGFLYDFTIPLWLSWHRTRGLAYAAVCAFHAAVGVLFNIGMFPFIMTTGALVFFPSSWPRMIRASLRRRASSAGGPQVAEPATPSEAPRALAPRLGRIGLVLGGAFVVAQLALPLRHLAYPGSVLWSEQGMRWAWKVLVREKNGAVTYVVRKRDGRRELVEPRAYLTEAQAREMSGQPDLILQLAHHIGRDFAARGEGPVEVRAEARVSLNGRRPKLLVDPTVDLVTIEDGLGVARWIEPEPGEPPLRLKSLARSSR